MLKILASFADILRKSGYDVSTRAMNRAIQNGSNLGVLKFSVIRLILSESEANQLKNLDNAIALALAEHREDQVEALQVTRYEMTSRLSKMKYARDHRDSFALLGIPDVEVTKLMELQIWGSHLRMWRTENEMYCDVAASAGQDILRKCGHLGGQLVLDVGLIPDFTYERHGPGSFQIHHFKERRHWVSTVCLAVGTVLYCCSCGLPPNQFILSDIKQIYKGDPEDNNRIKVYIYPVHKQTPGSNLCLLHALGNAGGLLSGKDVTCFLWKESEMRSHFEVCCRQKAFEIFPHETLPIGRILHHEAIVI